MAHDDTGASTPEPTPDAALSGAAAEPDASPAAAPLPAASPVARVRATVSRWSRRRKMLAIGSALGGATLITIGVLTTGAAAGPGYNAPVTVYADSTQASGQPADDSAEQISAEEPDDAVDPKDSTDPAERDDTTPDAADPPVSDATGPTTPDTSNPGTSDPGTDPGTPPPPPTSPNPPPPTTENPPPPTTENPPPVTPAPLAFAGLRENYVVGLLGIRVLGSYTLTITGQPGAIAAVTYGSTDAGSVTFDGNGHATTTLGGSLVNLGLSNPTIRVSYSDGTVGSAIEAARDSL